VSQNVGGRDDLDACREQTATKGSQYQGGAETEESHILVGEADGRQLPTETSFGSTVALYPDVG
jgi:hypothetical protein